MTEKTVTPRSSFCLGLAVCLYPRLSAPKLFNRGRPNGLSMAIRRLIAAGSYEPEKIRAMTDAYDIALIVLRLNDKDDPITELLAKSIAAVVATGECKPGEIASKAIDALGIKRPQS